MISSKTIRPDAACHSADVLTPVERAVTRMQRPAAALATVIPFRPRPKKWGDVKSIRDVLDQVRKTL